MHPLTPMPIPPQRLLKMPEIPGLKPMVKQLRVAEIPMEVRPFRNLTPPLSPEPIPAGIQTSKKQKAFKKAQKRFLFWCKLAPVSIGLCLVAIMWLRHIEKGQLGYFMLFSAVTAPIVTFWLWKIIKARKDMNQNR